MPATHCGARLPLLERLGREGHGRVLDGAGLRDSVGRELVRLLNTRTATPAALLPGAAPLSIIDYGLPDWSAAYGADFEDRQRLARSIERAVRVFEPRLCDVQVQVDLHPAGLRQLQVLLSGRLWLDGAVHQIRYGMGLDASGAAMLGMQELA